MLQILVSKLAALLKILNWRNLGDRLILVDHPDRVYRAAVLSFLHVPFGFRFLIVKVLKQGLVVITLMLILFLHLGVNIQSLPDMLSKFLQLTVLTAEEWLNLHADDLNQVEEHVLSGAKPNLKGFAYLKAGLIWIAVSFEI